MKDNIDVRKLQELKRNLQKHYPFRSKEIPEEFLGSIKELEDFIFNKHQHMDCHLPEYVSKEDVEFFQNVFCEYETILEEKKALDLLEHKCDANHCLFEDRVLSRTFEYAIEEGKMAKFSENDHVLIIGSGPFPETAIGYASVFKCKVTCIEKIPEYVEISRKVIERLGLTNKIEVVEGLGETADVSKFSKILITVLSKPKSKIIENLMRSNSELIVRTTFGSSRLIYESVSFSDIEGFEIKDELIRWGKNFTSSILLKPVVMKI